MYQYMTAAHQQKSCKHRTVCQVVCTCKLVEQQLCISQARIEAEPNPHTPIWNSGMASAIAIPIVAAAAAVREAGGALEPVLLLLFDLLLPRHDPVVRRQHRGGQLLA